jgi:hypothetical protein
MIPQKNSHSMKKHFYRKDVRRFILCLFLFIFLAFISFQRATRYYLAEAVVEYASEQDNKLPIDINQMQSVEVLSGCIDKLFLKDFWKVDKTEALKKLRNTLEIKPVAGTNRISIIVKTNHPTIAYDIATELPIAYANQRGEILIKSRMTLEESHDSMHTQSREKSEFAERPTASEIDARIDAEMMRLVTSDDPLNPEFSIERLGLSLEDLQMMKRSSEKPEWHRYSGEKLIIHQKAEINPTPILPKFSSYIYFAICSALLVYSLLVLIERYRRPVDL